MAAQQLRELAPEDLKDLSPVQPYSLFVSPFLGNGFTEGGIYIDYSCTTGNCRNCKGTGIDQDILKWLEARGIPLKNYTGGAQCQYCDGAGTVTVGSLLPVLGRVLRVHPSCKLIVPGDVVHFPPQAYDWVHLNERSFVVMDERVLNGIIEGYDTAQVTMVA
jgi:hypothetical protein